MSARSWRRSRLAVALLATACATVPGSTAGLHGAGSGGSGSEGPPICGGLAAAGGWPDHSSGDVALLAPFLACASPADFVELQRGVDMPRLLEALSDWSAVRLGAMGPLLGGADVLARKRAAFLVDAAEEYGEGYAEVFALFIIDAAFDDELRAMLELLAKDKQLQATLGPMCAAQAELEERGLRLSDFPERGERLSDVGRGLGRAARDVVASTELSRGLRFMELTSKRGQMPPPYQDAFDKVTDAYAKRQFAPGRVALGCLDYMTFGVPVGLYSLLAGTAQGASSLVKGQYEQATRELAPAVALVVLYAGGKGMRALSQAEGAGWGGMRLQAAMELRLGVLREVAGRLRGRLGESGVGQVARYIRARREAAILVAAEGEPAAVALHEAKGDVGRARLLMSQAKAEPALGGVASVVDEAAGLTAEVVQAKLLQAEVVESGSARLPADVALLERQRPRLDAPPPGVSADSGRWRDYVAYRERRLAELRSGQKVEGPLRWEGYERMWARFSRGLAFQRARVAELRADAALPKAQRRWLGDFEQPVVETNVGVAKPGVPGVRFADALVIETRPPPGQPPRVVSFSFKSRDFSVMDFEVLVARVKVDASAALRHYGGKLNVRRTSLRYLGPEVQVRRVRLVYEGGELTPTETDVWQRVSDRVRRDVGDVEVLVQ